MKPIKTTEAYFSRLGRREFLRLSGRLLLLGTGIAGLLFLQQREQLSPAPQPCSNRGFCRTCTLNRSCGLPAALSHRSKLTTN